MRRPNAETEHVIAIASPTDRIEEVAVGDLAGHQRQFDSDDEEPTGRIGGYRSGRTKFPVSVKGSLNIQGVADLNLTVCLLL